ncbi:LrgB family protein [Rummeliibacillus stabekisii]|uniref:CidB/LrgB family autolysis modulator n=1 Tax=Rummeliibacillus stabekisii TaxID=241244 RepID=A0A143HCV1_9BACL|nr:LrgB family protein [Rummeliibacillus stabekisii]AMW99259.1 CidB/LrgB family autolysis modulator [Rummeliibacillus stabekisii]
MNIFIAFISLIATIAIFLVSKKAYQKTHRLLLSPLIVSPLFLVILLLLTRTSYEQYNLGSSVLTKLLGPATVAFAVPIYKNLELIKKHAKIIVASLFTGSLVAILSSFFLAVWIGLSADMITSLVPRSITTPIAMDISKMIGGEPSMTAVFVIVTGLTGSITGAIIIRLFRIKTTAAKGLMLGMGAHGLGTSKAFEMGELEGTFSSVAMVIAALISILLSETFFPLLRLCFAM